MALLRRLAAWKTRLLYRYILKPIFFLMDAEMVHHMALRCGHFLGRHAWSRALLSYFYSEKPPLDGAFRQTIGNRVFEKPIGLAAGFDYRAELMNILSAIDFGFGTVGTVTHLPYEGNPRPRLGRLPRSKGLMVNKGFKNDGIEKILPRLHRARRSAHAQGSMHSSYLVGLSLGTTNNPAIRSVDDAVADLAQAYSRALVSPDFDYIELNISCPNLCHSIALTEPAALQRTLEALQPIIEGDLFKRPLFIKMPLGHSDAEAVALAEVARPFAFVTGLIFSNLQKNRSNPTLVPEEIAAYKAPGNISGLPCRDESTSRIKAVYSHFGTRFVIVGCGGIFNVDDAYAKIRAGASLLQLITGMIFEGPQLIGELHRGLYKRLQQDGFTHIRQVVGIDALSVHVAQK